MFVCFCSGTWGLSAGACRPQQRGDEPPRELRGAGSAMGASASSPDPPPPEASRKKKAPLSTLRKRLARRRWRASKGLDHAQVFHDFLVGSGCTLPEVRGSGLVLFVSCLPPCRKLPRCCCPLLCRINCNSHFSFSTCFKYSFLQGRLY